MGLLWLNVTARSPHPLRGGHEVLPARIAVSLSDVRARLEIAVTRLAPYREPPADTQAGRLAKNAADQHRQYRNLSSLLTEIGNAIERAEDMDCVERSSLGRLGGW